MSYKRILVPVDGSVPSAKGMSEAVRLAKSARARLMLLHVVDEYPAVAVAEAGVTIGPLIDAMRKSGERVLEKGARTAKRAGLKAQTAIVDNGGGGIAETIVRQAKRWKADLIVVGSHGRTGVRRALMGSDAESIARHSPVPVLVVPVGKRH